MSQSPHYGYPPQTPPPPVTSSFTASRLSSGGGSGRGPLRRKTVLGGLALVLLLAVGAWAAWAFTGDDSPGAKKPAQTAKGPAAGSVAWMAKPRTTPEKKFNSALGTWFTDHLVVKAEPDMVTAYDVKSGEKKWSFILTGPLCAASRESEGNVAVVATMFGGHCIDLKAFDLRDGHRTWDELVLADSGLGDTLSPEKWGKSEPRIALHEGHVYMTWNTGEQTRRLSDGKRVDEQKHDACEWVDAAGGAQLISITYCGEKEIQIRSLDPGKLGKPRWSTAMPRNDGFLSIVSTRPLVLSQSPGKNSADDQFDFVTLDPATGKEKARIAYNRNWRLGDCFLVTSGCTGALVDQDSLYVAGQGLTYAYDLTSGKERWTYKGDANRSTAPVAVHDGRLAVYTPATSDRPGRLAYVATSSGKALRTVDHSNDARDRKNEAVMGRIAGFPRLVDERLLLIKDGGLADENEGVILAISAPEGKN